MYFRSERMHEMRSNAIGNPVAWAFVGLPVMRVTVLTHSPDVATSMRPLEHYCNRLSVVIAAMFLLIY